MKKLTTALLSLALIVSAAGSAFAGERRTSNVLPADHPKCVFGPAPTDPGPNGTALVCPT